MPSCTATSTRSRSSRSHRKACEAGSVVPTRAVQTATPGFVESHDHRIRIFGALERFDDYLRRVDLETMPPLVGRRIGMRRRTYALMPYPGTFREVGVIQAAEDLNTPCA